jgi:ribosomal-protein-alanine N-acetyltransferase
VTDRDPDLRLTTERLVLHLPLPSAGAAAADYYTRNRAHLAPWDPPRPDVFFTPQLWDERLRTNREEYCADRSLRTFLELRDDPGRLVGTANLSNIIRGAFHACHLGYTLDASLQGRGLMHEALTALLAHGFHSLRLHRIQANYVPTNERSGRVLRRLGFAVEGYARDYLYIDGAWRDHVLTALTSPTPGPPDLPASCRPVP